jgi:hypothetical protein
MPEWNEKFLCMFETIKSQLVGGKEERT